MADDFDESLDIGRKTRLAGLPGTISTTLCRSTNHQITRSASTANPIKFHDSVELIHHSDRGSQYAATDYRKVLDGAAMIQSMSRKGNCWDNAPMESCFGTIKTELVHHACYPTREAAQHDLFAYIEGYYNRQRLHSALGYITPEQAERQAA